MSSSISNNNQEPTISALELLTDPVTALSLGLTVVLLAAAYLASLRVLGAAAGKGKVRTLFIWHLFDALVHFMLESTFVYHSLFSVATAAQLVQQPEAVRALPYRVAGAAFSDAPMAKLWQVYAAADLRWGIGEPNIVAMEILTVAGAGSIAAYVVYLISRDESSSSSSSSSPSRSQRGGKEKWFWMAILATMELYGGFMTFVPEWIVGSPNLVTSNWVYKWLYLFFFNTLWVWFPAWILWEAYAELLVLSPLESTNTNANTNTNASASASANASANAGASAGASASAKEKKKRV